MLRKDGETLSRLQHYMVSLYLQFLQRSDISMDTAVKDFRQIFCRLREITLERIPMKEQTSQEASSSIQTGQDAAERLHHQHITYNLTNQITYYVRAKKLK